MSEAQESPYAKRAPHPQQTLDIFKGHWASAFPPVLGSVQAGGAQLFQDPRVAWAKHTLAALGRKLEESHVLELGPLEGGHTYLLAQQGARSVTAVEAHPEAYLKCLVAKELLGIERVNFLFGDAMEFLRATPYHYDFAFVSGLLYHMEDPVELIRLLAEKCRALFLWTVYWDGAFSKANPQVLAGSGPVTPLERDGVTYTLHKHDYGSGFNYGKFWGGPAAHSQWMEISGIEAALDRYGFKRRTVELEPNPNGAAVRLVAVRD